MIVLVLTACPNGLRGFLTRWLLEISPGVYVGKSSARVRDAIWARTVEMVGSGRAIMVENARNEQGLTFRTHHHDWIPVDIDGLQLMLRPKKQGTNRLKSGWSLASRRRRARKLK